MQVAPKGGPPAPAPSGQGGPAQGPSPAQAVQMIQAGFQALSKIIQQSGSQLPPEDVKLFQQAAQATDAFIQSVTSAPQEQQAPARAQQSGPMAMNANSGAKPAPM